MPSKKRFFGGLVGANPLRSGSFQDPGSVARTSSNEGVVSIDTAGPETSTTTAVVLNDYSTKTETQFNASNAGANDQFGTNCALSGDGTIAVFGAPYEDGASNTLSNYGAAYVYENGTEVAILRASDQSYLLGYDVAISKDGSLIVVGSPFAPNGSYTNSGKLYIFEKPAGGWGSATTEDYQISTNNTEAYLGRHVRLTDNGDTIIATATLSSQERVLVYNRGSAWSDRTGQNATLSASNWGSGDGFGIGLAISGDGSVIAVGSPDEDTTQSESGSVYIYHKPTNGWATATETHFIGSFSRSYNARFGKSCSLNEDGTILAIGEWNYGSSSGRIHVREYNGSTWSHSGVLTGAGSNDYLGASVCISRDGNTIAGGAPNDDLGKGALHIYFKPSSGWGNASHNYKLTTTSVPNNAYLGGSVNYTFTQPLALSNDGRKVLSAANQDDDVATASGSGFLFTATGGTASTTTTTTQTSQWFWGGLRGRYAIGEGAGAAGDDKSLRFDGSGDYLNRVVTASNRTKWTWSAWVKKNDLGTRDYLFSGGAAGDASNLFYLTWEDNANGTTRNNQLYVVWRAGSTTTYNIGTSASYNDTSAWYHVVLSVDTTKSNSSDRMKIYIDDAEVSYANDNRSSITKDSSLSVNAAGNLCMGAYAYDLTATNSRFKGQMAEVHFVDGQALDASYFGETRDGVWVPKEVTGVTYGNNGFYLDYKGNDTGVTLLLDGSSKTSDVVGLATISATSGITATTASPDAYDVTGGAVLESADDNQKITASGTNLFTLNDDFTLEAWVKIDAEGAFDTLFRIGNNTYASLIGFNQSSGSWSLYLPNATDDGWSTNNVTLFTGLTAGSGWHHVAFTKSGTTFRGFVDGTQTSADIVNATTFPIGNGHLLIGIGSGYGIEGQWQDVRYTKGYVRDIAAGFSSGTPISGGGWDVALTNDIQYFGNFGVDRSTNNNDFSVEGNIKPDDQLLDTPNLRFESLTTASSGVTLSEANYTATMPGTAQDTKTRTNDTLSGKIYFEFVLHSSNNTDIGLTTSTAYEEFVGQNSSSLGWFISPGSALQAYTGGQSAAAYIPQNTSGTYAAGDVVGLAIDTTAKTIRFYKNGVAYGDSVSYSGWSTSPVYFTLGNYVSGQEYRMNFGQDHTFAGEKPALTTPYSDANGVGEFYYQPPSGFLALADNYVVTEALATTGVLSTSEMLQASL